MNSLGDCDTPMSPIAWSSVFVSFSTVLLRDDLEFICMGSLRPNKGEMRSYAERISVLAVCEQG